MLLFRWAQIQPLQIHLPQHDINVDASFSRGIGKKQIGHSPLWVPSGCVNKRLLCNSSTRFLHSSWCCSRCSSRHLSLQYFTRSQPPSHSSNLTLSTPAMPQFAQHMTPASAPASDVLLMSIKKTTKVLLIALESPASEVDRVYLCLRLEEEVRVVNIFSVS